MASAVSDYEAGLQKEGLFGGEAAQLEGRLTARSLGSLCRHEVCERRKGKLLDRRLAVQSGAASMLLHVWSRDPSLRGGP